MKPFKSRAMMLAAALLACASLPNRANGETVAMKELTPTGKLRAGIVYAPALSVFFAVRDADGRPRGVTVDLADELARQLGVAADFMVAPNSGLVTDAVESGAVRRLHAGRRRAQDARRLRPELLSDRKHLYGHRRFRDQNPRRGRSSQCPGRRHRQHHHDPCRRPELEKYHDHGGNFGGSGRRVASDGRGRCFRTVARFASPAQLPGSRIVDGGFQQTGIAIAVAKGRAGVLAYVRAFLEDAKASGSVRRALDRAGFRDQPVAPPAE